MNKPGIRYSIVEFRKNTREILDSVDRGADVMIQRYDKLYSIKPTVRGNSALPIERKNTAVKGIDPANTRNVVSTSHCQHGQEKGECLVKGCEFGRKK